MEVNHLSNAFSLLKVDVADDVEGITATAGDNNSKKKNERAKGKKKDSTSGEITDPKRENGSQQIAEVVPGEYKLPLVWIDLEMTGLNIETDRILEIACIITNGNLTKSVEVILTSLVLYAVPFALSGHLPLICCLLKQSFSEL